MPFIGRREDGSIYGLWTVRQWPDQEELSDTHPDVQAFNPVKPPRDLSELDNLDKTLKAALLCVAHVGGLTPIQMKALFKAKFEALNA